MLKGENRACQLIEYHERYNERYKKWTIITERCKIMKLETN